MPKDYDLVAIGDITTDAFIRLKDASVFCDVNREKCKLCVSFGDKVPYEFVEVVQAVGNSPNAAVAAARLGLRSGLVANVGDDQNGGECLATLKRNSVALEFMTAHRHKETNYHYVLWYEDERTILVKHQEFAYKLPDFGTPAWIYLSSLGPSSLSYHEEIIGYLAAHPTIKLAFQPGTFQIKLGTSRLGELYKHAEVLFCNVDEAKRILGIIEEVNIAPLLEKLRSLGSKLVVITDGPKGAYSYDGERTLFMPPYPDPKPPFERTGAGDAFSSTFTAALALGKNVEEALRWAPVNAMSVVQYIGAQRGLLSREEIERIVREAPENYQPKALS
ncbi:carbohydrate kinase family protein [Patescibacteria group bacterium]|nr:MAG: carbohydrate kinase family protein [Patescibacteria group bacterium]